MANKLTNRLKVSIRKINQILAMILLVLFVAKQPISVLHHHNSDLLKEKLEKTNRSFFKNEKPQKCIICDFLYHHAETGLYFTPFAEIFRLQPLVGTYSIAACIFLFFSIPIATIGRAPPF